MGKVLHLAVATGVAMLVMATPASQIKTRNVTVAGMSFGYVDVGWTTSDSDNTVRCRTTVSGQNN